MTRLVTRSAAATLALAVTGLFPGAAALGATGSGSGRIDHVQTRHGQVEVLYSVPGLAGNVVPDPSTIKVSFNGKPVKATAAPVSSSSSTVRRTAVLAIDVSNSMRGPSFTAARQAARTYVAQAPTDVYIGLVTFASRVQVVQAPTENRQALTRAIDGLALSPQTRLYDGVRAALSVAGKAGQRSMLLLSDGHDTTGAPLGPVLTAAKASGVRVDVVGLNQTLDATSPLTQVARVTQGTVASTSNLNVLKRLFASEANDLSKQLLVTFPAPVGTAVQQGNLTVSVAAGGQTTSDSAFVSLTPRAPAPTAPTYTPAPSSGPALGLPVMLGGVLLLFVGLALFLVLAGERALPAEASPMQQQLALYTVAGVRRSKPPRQPKDAGAVVKETAVRLAEEFAERRNFQERLSTKLERAGVDLLPGEWLLIHAGIAIAAAIGAAVFFGGFLFALLGLIIGLVLPWVYLSFKDSRRIKAFNGQLAQTLQIIAGALQAGLSLSQAVDTVVKEGAEPVSGEFRKAIIEQRLGVEIEDTLDSVAERMGSVDFKWVVMAIRIQREVGGNLSELLLTVAATLREREYLRRQVSVLSAEGRLSAWILGGLPPVFMVYLILVRPTYVSPMFHSTLGFLMLAVAAVLMSVGVFWLSKVVKVEV